MRKQDRVALFAAILLCLTCSAFGRDRAVLVGINTYLPEDARSQVHGSNGSTRWSNLDGAVNDVRAMSNMLQLRYGVADESIVTLTEQQASRSAIIHAIEEELIAHGEPGKRFLFYFSGHGSRVRLSADDEIGEVHETIVPADSWRGAPDIPDKLLRKLFNQVLDTGAELIVIFDSCHSGGATRGDGARTLPEAAQDLQIPADYGDLLERRGGIQVMSAEANELAREWSERPGGETMGAFTHLLIQELMREPNQSISGVIDRVRGLLQAYGYYQNPVLRVGDRQGTMPFFRASKEGHVETPMPIVKALEMQDGRIHLWGGIDLGLYPGSLVVLDAQAQRDAVFLESATSIQISADQELVLEVIESDGLSHSFARPIEEPVEWPELPAWASVLYLAAPAIEPLSIWLGEQMQGSPSNEAADVVREMRQLTETIEGIVLAEDQASADLYLNADEREGRCLQWAVNNARGIMRHLSPPPKLDCRILDPVDQGVSLLQSDLLKIRNIVSADALMLSSGSAGFPYSIETELVYPRGNDGQALASLNIRLQAEGADQLARAHMFDPGGGRRYLYLWAMTGDLVVHPICEHGDCNNHWRIPPDETRALQIPLVKIELDEPTSIVLFGIFSTTRLRSNLFDVTRSDSEFDLRQSLLRDRILSRGGIIAWHTEIVPIHITSPEAWGSN